MITSFRRSVIMVTVSCWVKHRSVDFGRNSDNLIDRLRAGKKQNHRGCVRFPLPAPYCGPKQTKNIKKTDSLPIVIFNKRSQLFIFNFYLKKNKRTKTRIRITLHNTHMHVKDRKKPPKQFPLNKKEKKKKKSQSRYYYFVPSWILCKHETRVQQHESNQCSWFKRQTLNWFQLIWFVFNTTSQANNASK